MQYSFIVSMLIKTSRWLCIGFFDVRHCPATIHQRQTALLKCLKPVLLWGIGPHHETGKWRKKN